jgi:hypothetical protein
LNKPGKGTVIDLFHLGRKNTAGKLIILQVIGNAFTALAFSGTGFIGTGAIDFIGAKLTFHITFSFNHR